MNVCLSVVAQVMSMLKEPKLAVFYSPPKHDLKLNYDEEIRLENEDINPVQWPDIGESLTSRPLLPRM